MVARATIAGDNQDAQYDNVAKMKSADFATLCSSDQGFRVHLTVGVGVVIPSSFIVLVVQSSDTQDCHGLRIQSLPGGGGQRKCDCLGSLNCHAALHPEQKVGRFAAVLDYLAAD